MKWDDPNNYISLESWLTSRRYGPAEVAEAFTMDCGAEFTAIPGLSFGGYRYDISNIESTAWWTLNHPLSRYSVYMPLLGEFEKWFEGRLGGKATAKHESMLI